MRARKRFGQHFLEPAWVAKLVTAIDARPDEAVLEIGPGRGAITLPLASRAGRLLAIEIDRDLAAALEARALPRVTVVTGDFLDLDIPAVVETWLGAPLGPESAVRVVGNLPYNVSSPILFRLLELAATTGGLRDAVLMLQAEVADRLIAAVGTAEYGVLTILTGLGAETERLLALPPGAFRPAPKVRSAVVRLRFRPPPVPIADPALLVAMVRSMFTQRRKTLLNALKPFAADLGCETSEALSNAGIAPIRRPETLQLVEIARLADTFAAVRR
ncbi:MAG: 16S rRNA (adenine(1518)-N(6)/adenine(1519)-N(6))-dimethyltransferase RsmA [Vicinamibacterales bacterium]|nr:16S rRNA (adenine(1518)-N(6)/adenine(1519)-N(6))-dimethyltransferase RsmA [Vicinamibacterales bacterium]